MIHLRWMPPDLLVGEINRGSSAVVRLGRTKADREASADFAASDTLASLRSPSEAPASRPRGFTIALAAAQAPHKLPVGKIPSYLRRPRGFVKILGAMAVFTVAVIAANFVVSQAWGADDIVGTEDYQAQGLDQSYAGNIFTQIQEVLSSAELTSRLLASAGSLIYLDKDISNMATDSFPSRVAGEFIEKAHPSGAFGFFSAAMSSENSGKIFVNGFRASIDKATLNGSSLLEIFQAVASAAGE